MNKEQKELADQFEKELFALVNSYAKKGLEKSNSIKRLEWVLGSNKMS